MSTYKNCAVPMCFSTTIKCPSKAFVYVSKHRRRQWLKLARRDPKCFSEATGVYFCEDHFDLRNDMEYYREYSMGEVSEIRIKEGCYPTKFECQKKRIKKRRYGGREKNIVEWSDDDDGICLPVKKLQPKTKKLTIGTKKPFMKKDNIIVSHNTDKEGVVINSFLRGIRDSQPVRVTSGPVPVEFEKHKKNAAQGNYIKMNEQDGEKGLSVGNEMFLTDITSREFQYTIIGSHKELPRINIGQCRFCGEYSKSFFDIHHIPYLNYSHTSLVMNHLSVQLDFKSDSLPKTVCFDCKVKLEEMRDFLILVKETQEKFKVETKRKDVKDVKKDVDNNISMFDDEETKSALEDGSLIKVECESPTEEVNDSETDVPFKIDNQFKLKMESESDVDIKEDILTIEETVVGMNCNRKTEELSEWKNVQVNSVKKLDYDIDIKEELIEKDVTNGKSKLRNFRMFTSSNALHSVNCNSVSKITKDNSIEQIINTSNNKKSVDNSIFEK